MDIVIISYFVFVLAWAIIYHLWQFDIIGGSETAWKRFFRFQDIIETIVFILTRFVPYGIWGARALCATYCLHIICLIIQLVFADWDGIMWKIQTALWIAFYIAMIFIDIAHVDIVSLILNRSIDYIEENAAFVKKIGIGTCIELVLFLVGKWSDIKKQDQT